jgi:hypothetical protein
MSETPAFRIAPATGGPEATCPHCGCINAVAGLCLDSPDAIARQYESFHEVRLVCGSCGKTFEATRPAPEERRIPRC